MRRWIVRTIAIIGLFGCIVSACLVELERRIACGDGHVDKKAGEECDPADPNVNSIRRCTEEFGPSSKLSCDPTTCQIGCCGDHIIDIGEQCDGPTITESCLGDGQLQCKADCTYDRSKCIKCGNGIVDGDEECDPQEQSSTSDKQSEDESIVIDCMDLKVVGAPYTNGIRKKNYFSGKIHRSACHPQTCEFQRNGCGFCGDGIRDDQFSDYANQIVYPAEQCDIEDMLPSTVHQYCLDRCANHAEASFVAGDLRCTYDCNSSCRLSPLEGAQDDCCIKTGRPCGPSVSDMFSEMPCCVALDNPQIEQEACVANPDTGQHVCTAAP